MMTVYYILRIRKCGPTIFESRVDLDCGPLECTGPTRFMRFPNGSRIDFPDRDAVGLTFGNRAGGLVGFDLVNAPEIREL